MKSTKISNQVQNVVQSHIRQYPLLEQVVKQLAEHAQRVLLVGGAVRDALLDKPIKDIDIEVHGLTLEQLEKMLSQYGIVDTVGKVFGVVRLHGLDVDWSVPRSDTPGRKPTVTFDPTMAVEDAFRRRDLTINAMGIDLRTYALHDPFGGEQDLRNKVLRTPDPTFFIQDPLRLFRVMQFIGRFECLPDQELTALCTSMSLEGVSRERIEDEFEKLMLKSSRPSLGIRWLKDIGRLQELLPEVAALINVPQRPDRHPEGDVFEHTMQVVDAAARITYPDSDNTLILRYAALCHDLGKATTTKNVDGIWRSHGHAKAGVPIAKKLLKRITCKKIFTDPITRLVEYHMHPGQLVSSDAPLSSYKRLAHALAPWPLQLLVDLFRVDRQGRNPESAIPFTALDDDVKTFEQRVKQAQVFQQHEPPVLQGKDLLGIVEPGPRMGTLLKEAYAIQLEEEIRDKDQLKARILKNR